ncbi:MAG TPA: hypothetical protein VMM93_13060 [Vicinamibacterales bacterium]|nr:hypothetical protein [Vicinamibacterales bacterium]
MASRNRLRRIGPLALALCLAIVPLPAAAQSTTGPPPNAKVAAGRSAVDLDRIREAVSRDPAIKVDDGLVRFYLQINAPRVTIADLMKDEDLKHAPVAGAPITHREFLAMVTPKEVYGGGGIRPTELAQMAITGIIGQMLAKKAFESITDTWRARQIREINERIDLELASLRGRDK